MTTAKLGPLLRRGVAEIIVEQELVRMLESGKPLRLKQGFDPSCPDIHLGHVVGLRKLRQFQEMGHQVILIVGDWTAQIGDPSGESVTRPMLTAEQVKSNAETYLQQFFKVVDKEKTEVKWQSEWFGNFDLADVVRLTSKFTVAQFLAREDFGKRYREGRPIAITELLYPLLQAYDSVAIEADVEFGGIDQKFNCLVGRELQAMIGQRPQQIFLVPLLVGTDGTKKMSKSLGNYVGVTDPPNDMYGKLMSIPDDLIIPYFELLTDVPDAELGEMAQQIESGSVNPMLLKKRLAGDIVTQFHGDAAAKDAAEYFVRVVQRKEVPEEDILLHRTRLADSVKVDDVLLATKLVKSRSEARRLLTQGAIELDGEKVGSNVVTACDGSVLKVGKRRFVKLIDTPG
ncbi:MAG: tyrosine--tRNA ligase [Chloroflexi bacterium]|mgnify:CR=1 FL=1|nr:MAG: tyrosine--tRNA ligase [Chloroflexota bacterium]RLC93330.1 MAG: tyrosine--tRNA ligase [Chloroflexota bacterium]